MRYFFGDIVEITPVDKKERVLFIRTGMYANGNLYGECISYFAGEFRIVKYDMKVFEGESCTYIGSIDISFLVQSPEDRKKIFLDRIHSVTSEQANNQKRIEEYRKGVQQAQLEGWE